MIFRAMKMPEMEKLPKGNGLSTTTTFQEDEILGEFLDTFEDHFCDISGNEDARDGKIT